MAGCLVALADAMQEMARHFVSEPPCWFRSLLRADKHEAVVKLDAGKLSRLGASVEAQVRVVKRIMDFQQRPDTPEASIFRTEVWTSKDLLSDGLLAVGDLTKFANTEDGEGIEGLAAVIEQLKKSASLSIADAQNTLTELKAKVSGVFADAAEAQRLMSLEQVELSPPEALPQGIKDIVAKYDKDTGAMNTAVDGCSDVQTYEIP